MWSQGQKASGKSPPHTRKDEQAMSKKNARHKPSKKEICRIIYQLHDERMLQLIRGIVEACYREDSVKQRLCGCYAEDEI